MIKAASLVFDTRQFIFEMNEAAELQEGWLRPTGLTQHIDIPFSGKLLAAWVTPVSDIYRFADMDMLEAIIRPDKVELYYTRKQPSSPMISESLDASPSKPLRVVLNVIYESSE